MTSLVQIAKIPPYQAERGALCMKGGIYKNKGPEGAPLIVKFPGGIYHRFWDEVAAERFLNGLRFKHDEGILDPRDYRKDNPLGFETLTTAWLRRRGKMKSSGAAKSHLDHATAYFGNRNIREIAEGELEDFFDYLEGHTSLSSKTRYNIRTTLVTFWRWVVKRNKRKPVPIPMPDFPEVPYSCAYRKTVSLKDQDEILEDIRQHASARAWVACVLLATYPKIRPGELRSVKEKDIDLDLGILVVRHPKSPDPAAHKQVALLPEHVDLIRGLPAGFPEQYFLRHDEGRHKGKPYGINYLRRWVWDPACQRLGIAGVSLYPGTKHSTVRGLRAYFRPDEIQRGAGLSSNRAFDRYYRHEFEDELRIYRKRERLRAETNLKPKSKQRRSPKVLKLQARDGVSDGT